MPTAGSCPSGCGHLSPTSVLVLFFLWHFLLHSYLAWIFTVLWADHAEIYGAEKKNNHLSLKQGCVWVCV